jgi:hypothetical protein
VELSAIALRGLDAAQAGLDQSAGRIARATEPASDTGPANSVDLSTAIVGLLSARQDFAVNIKMLKTADEMELHAIDLLA